MWRPTLIRSRTWTSFLIACTAFWLPVSSLGALQNGAAETVSRAQSALDRGDPAAALELTKVFLKRNPQAADALLIQSTAHLMMGDAELGERELTRVLQLDPTLRQAWLNRAGLAMASEDFSAALEAFEKAHEIDPASPDNDLNLGATRLLLGDLDRAAKHFEAYLGGAPNDAGAFYLVASNYAMGGYAAFAMRHLLQSIRIDERSRRRARRDPNFVAMGDHPRFLDLMSTDIYVLPEDARRTARVFKGAFDGGRGPLLPSVLDALYGLQEAFDPNVEVTEDWALIWARYRIKLRPDDAGGVVELSAPKDQFSAEEWERESKRLFDSIYVQILRRL